MQKTVYYCDQCRKIIGDRVHITLALNKGLSGLAVPPKALPANQIGPELYTDYNQNGWHVERVSIGFMHFHVSCIEKYFVSWQNKLMNKKVEKTNKKKK